MLHDFLFPSFGFVSEFSICCRVLGFHKLITSQPSTHTPRCSTPTPRFFVSQFPGDQFSGDHFSGDDFSEDHFSRDHFSWTIFPGIIFPGFIYIRHEWRVKDHSLFRHDMTGEWKTIRDLILFNYIMSIPVSFLKFEKEHLRSWVIIAELYEYIIQILYADQSTEKQQGMLIDSSSI